MRRLSDTERWTSLPDTPIREVAEGINTTQLQFCVIVDDRSKLVGTVTDGDIRRSLLNGVDLDAPISVSANTNPTYAVDGEDDTLPGLVSRHRFIPIVDSDHRVIGVAVPTDPSRPVVAALVMAGGKGSRLGEHTQKTPKPLLNVAGKPIMEHVLGKIEAAGVERIFVSVNYLADQVRSFLDERKGKVPVETVPENSELGTAGAVGLLPSLNGTFVVMNGDIVSDVDLAMMAEYHHQNANDVTVAVAGFEVSIPYGVIVVDEDGRFTGIKEKPRETHFVAAGVYMLEPHVANIVPPETRIDMPEVLNRAKGLGMRIGVYPIHEYWRDIGNPVDLEAARSDRKTDSEEGPES